MKQLKGQQSFIESVRDRLDEIQCLMNTVNGGGPNILGHVNLRDIIKDLFMHALNVIDFIECHAKEEGKGKGWFSDYGLIISQVHYPLISFQLSWSW